MLWEILWKIVLLFTLFAFSILTVVVTIGGIKDIKSMIEDFKSHT